MIAASGRLNAPSEALVTDAVSVFKATYFTEITRIIVHGDSEVVAAAYHMPEGIEQVHDGYIIWKDEIADAEKTLETDYRSGTGPSLRPGQSLWVSATGTGAYFNIYGVTASASPELTI